MILRGPRSNPVDRPFTQGKKGWEGKKKDFSVIEREEERNTSTQSSIRFKQARKGLPTRRSIGGERKTNRAATWLPKEAERRYLLKKGCQKGGGEKTIAVYGGRREQRAGPGRQTATGRAPREGVQLKKERRRKKKRRAGEQRGKTYERPKKVCQGVLFVKKIVAQDRIAVERSAVRPKKKTSRQTWQIYRASSRVYLSK